MGTPYDWFRSAEELLARGDASAAAVLLEHVVREVTQPGKGSVVDVTG